MLIDPLNIFQDIKAEIRKILPAEPLYAFGSRASGKTRQGKWDFDVLIVTSDNLTSFYKDLRNKFSTRLDENGKPVAIDIWTTTEKDFEGFINEVNRSGNVILL